MGEPGGLPSMGLHRVGHNWSDLAAASMCNDAFEFKMTFELAYFIFVCLSFWKIHPVFEKRKKNCASKSSTNLWFTDR